jgi:hypothetical protein
MFDDFLRLAGTNNWVPAGAITLSGGLYCQPESAKVEEYENYFLELSFGVGGLS